MDKDHVITMINDDVNYCHDITGKVSSDGYRTISPVHLDMVKEWSFSGRKFLSIGECRNCEEPIIV